MVEAMSMLVLMASGQGPAGNTSNGANGSGPWWIIIPVGVVIVAIAIFSVIRRSRR